jgi:hypothetical protein
MLLKISGEKLCEMDELEMGPVDVFLPRFATATGLSSCFHLKHCWRMKWFKDASFYAFNSSLGRRIKWYHMFNVLDKKEEKKNHFTLFKSKINFIK